MTRTRAASAAWQRAEAERAFWEKHGPELAERYKDKYVAVFGGEVIAARYEVRDLMDELDARGIPIADAWVRFMDSRPATLIL